jgi:mRNA-degrading endonuclease RelE of RelBE toxin-antitoxin system
VLAKEYALEAFDELRGYVKEHPADLVQIVESYVRDKHRFSEHNEVARFLHYLVLRGDMYLDEEDGENHLFDLVTKKRAVIREEIPKQNFDRIWRIVTILKRSEVVVTPEFLRQWFKQHLDSDVSTEVLAVAMIQNNWHTDSRISTPYREFLGWSVRERLNISHYSYLFSGENKSSVSQKKKRKVTLKAEQAEEVFEAVSQEKSLESWTFFISRTSNSVESVIAPTPQAFSEYFGNDLINVTGEKVLEKLEYLLSFDEYQRMVFPGIKLVYKGYHKLRIGVVRIFWKIVPTEKEIHFFVVNRRDAY